jgi:hypothetical protein
VTQTFMQTSCQCLNLNIYFYFIQIFVAHEFGSYASLYGLAKRNNKVPLLDADNPFPFAKHFPTTILSRSLKYFNWTSVSENVFFPFHENNSGE